MKPIVVMPDLSDPLCVSSAVPFLSLQAFPHWGTRIKVRHCCQLLRINCRSLRIGSSRNNLCTKPSFFPLISVTSYSLIVFTLSFLVCTMTDSAGRRSIMDQGNSRFMYTTEKPAGMYEDMGFWPHFNRP